MKTCQNCGTEMEQDALFCRECGTRFSENNQECGTAPIEQSENMSGKTLPYLDEILDRHLEHFPNKLGKDVITFVSMMAESHYCSLLIHSDSTNPLRIVIILNDSSKREKEVLERFKKMEYYPRFTADLTWSEDGYCGYIDLSADSHYAKAILSSLILDVYRYQEKSPLGYSIKMGGRSIGKYDIKDGIHVKSKGCLSVVIALIVLGGTLISLI